VMRKGYRCEAGSEGSAKQRCEPMDKNRIRGASVGRAGNVSRSPYPSRTRSVDPAVGVVATPSRAALMRGDRAAISDADGHTDEVKGFLARS
jgi:hypothetical protein